MAGTDFFRTFKGLSEVKLYSIKEDLVYNLPVALDLSIDNGIQERRIPSRNVFGEQVFSNSFTVARDPVLRIVFPTMTPEVLEFKTERSFTSQTGGTFKYQVAKTIDPTYMSEITVGTGQNVEQHYLINLNTLIGLDPMNVTTITGVKSSYTLNNMSADINTTLNSTGGTNNAAGAYITVPKANFEEGQYLSLLIECKDNVINLGSKLDGFFKLFATMVTTENQLVVLTAPKVKPSFQGSTFSPSMEQVETIFYMSTPAGQCKAYDIIYTNTIVDC